MGKVYCTICKKRCRGNVLKVSDAFFHKDCFRCTRCNCKLESCGFFQKDKMFLCQNDYLHIIQKCKVCGEAIDDEAVSAFSFSFHKSCFICNVCKCSFNPGDKVTVWKDTFFCSSCSPSRDKDDRTTPKHRLSFADQLAPPRPTAINSNTNGFDDLSAMSDLETPTNCRNMNGFKQPPKILKSSLRNSANHQIMLSSDCEYSNADSDRTDRLNPPKSTHNDFNTLPTNSSVYLMHMQRSKTVGPDDTHSVYSSGRHGLSDYGRFYNLSYMNISAPPIRRATDQYRRSGTTTPSLTNSVTKLHHFHIPEGPSRYGNPQNGRDFASSLGDALGKLKEPVIRKARELHNNYDSTYASSENVSSPNATPKSISSPRFSDKNITNGSHMSFRGLTTHRNDRDASLEARRLSNFPAGQPPDANASPAIERYDWPAPASSAVLMAEMMRDRRHKEREQGRLNGIHDDVDSFEDLSLNISLDSSSDAAVGAGIGKAILLEEEELKRRKYRTQRVLDPISSSRTPNASSEPPYKTRYDSHGLSGNATVRSSHAAADPRLPSKKITSLPHEAKNSEDIQYSIDDKKNTCRRSEETEKCVRTNGNGLLNGYAPAISKNSPSLTKSTHCGLNGAGDNGFLRDSVYPDTSGFTHGNSMRTSILDSVIRTTSPPPFKEFSYKELICQRKKLPPGIDRLKLESYLSDAEFSEVFGLKKIAFYRLPEWKRNDLKRHVQLF